MVKMEQNVLFKTTGVIEQGSDFLLCLQGRLSISENEIFTGFDKVFQVSGIKYLQDIQKCVLI